MGGSGNAGSFEVRAFAPGRTELAGNHTDHQGGRVIAAAIDLGTTIELRRVEGLRARVESAGFEPIEIDVREGGPRAEERFTTAALVRGVVALLRDSGVHVAGFEARVSSTLPLGGGLSSSASFELALAAGLAALFGAEPSPLELALLGQEVEQRWFGKPCGLMDQAAIAFGGVVAFDFDDARAPIIETIPFDFSRVGYAICLVDTGSDHSALTDEYARVPADMRAVARFLGAERLRDVGEEEFLSSLAHVRAGLGDLPALRVLHYYLEMRLVDERARALCEGDMEAFLAATRRSGASSAQYLQNVSPMGSQSQPAMVALALCDYLLDEGGACRIHGGGFGGSIQAFVPLASAGTFAKAAEARLGTACRQVGVCAQGARASWL